MKLRHSFFHTFIKKSIDLFLHEDRVHCNLICISMVYSALRSEKGGANLLRALSLFEKCKTNINDVR